MSSLINSLLDTLQNKSFLGFPYLYWAISAVLSILLCCCVCCCMCCRRNKKEHMVENQSGSTEMTTIDAATRRSMGSAHQHHEENNNSNKHQQQKQQKQQKQRKQQRQPQESSYNKNNNNNNRFVPKRNKYRAEKTYAGLKPAVKNYNNNNPTNTNNQNQYGNNNHNNQFGNTVNDNEYRNNNQNGNNQQYGNNDNQYDNQQYGNNQNQNQYGNNNNNVNQNRYENDSNNQNVNNNNNNNQNQNQNQSQYQNDNNNQYGNNNQNNPANDDNSHKPNDSFGVKIPTSIYHPVSYKNVFNAKTANTNNNNGHVYDQHKFSRSPQPNQSYNLRPNQQNNYPSNSAPAPNTNQIHELQQQFPPPINNPQQNQQHNNNNKGFEIRKLGDGQSRSKYRNKYNKKKKNKRVKHAPAFSDIDESKLKKQQSKAAKNMKLDIQVDDFDDEIQESQDIQEQIKAPPKRNRVNQLSPVDAGGGYGGLSAPQFRKKRGGNQGVNPDDYSDSEERAKMSQWDARRSSVNAGAQLSSGNIVNPFKGRRRSVFDESSSEEDEQDEEFDGRRLTVDLTSAKNSKVSSHMANLNKYH